MSDPVFVGQPRKLIDVDVDGRTVRVPEGSTILDACRAQGIETPTLCYLENLTPVNVCRVCVVELEGARVLAPACSRTVEAGMKVRTDTERVRTSRKLVLELRDRRALRRARDLCRTGGGSEPDRVGGHGPECIAWLADDDVLHCAT